MDPEKCMGCGICADSICLAMSLEGGLAKVNVDMCLGCGMCVAVWPRGGDIGGLERSVAPTDRLCQAKIAWNKIEENP